MTDDPVVFATHGEVLPPAKRTIETVERKGIGHPDTMADLVAEIFCYRYAQYCAERFSYVPNHSADKITLTGADAVVRLGGYEIVEPVHAYLFGKVTRMVGGEAIPVDEIFDSAVSSALSTCTRYPDILAHTKTHVRSVVGKPLDHHPGYYGPDTTGQLASMIATERLSNDTVACAGASALSPLERFVLDAENYLQGPAFRSLLSGTGSDIKVLSTRCRRHVDVTICLPFHPEAIHSWAYYGERVAHARRLIEDFIRGNSIEGIDQVDVHLNQRDVPGRGYLAPFGTCLGKGDIGAVGRGNKLSGVIALSRAMSVEAPAGKNLMHHSGKIYSILAHWIADAVHSTFGIDNEVVITARVGASLDRPASVTVNLAEPGPSESDIRALVNAHLDNVEEVTNFLLKRDPLSAMSGAD